MIVRYFYNDPEIRVNKEADKWRIVLHRAGLDKKNIDITLKEKTLTVSLPETDVYIPYEKSWEFEFMLTEKLVNADYKDGVLTITVDQPEGHVKKVLVS